jgi:hypothetical protein
MNIRQGRLRNCGGNGAMPSLAAGPAIPDRDIAGDTNVLGISLSEDSKAAARWSLASGGEYYEKPPTPVFINLDNVLTVERQSVHATGELTLVTMVGGENVYIDPCRRRLLALSHLRVPCPRLASNGTCRVCSTACSTAYNTS